MEEGTIKQTNESRIKNGILYTNKKISPIQILDEKSHHKKYHGSFLSKLPWTILKMGKREIQTDDPKNEELDEDA